MHFVQNVVAFFVANSKSSWIFRVPFTLKSQYPVTAGNLSVKSFKFCCIFLIHVRKWKIGHWQDFVNETGGFACILLLCIHVTVKFWQEQTFAWFPISKYSLPFGSLVTFVWIHFCFFVFVCAVCSRSIFLSCKSICLFTFFNLPVHNLSHGLP